MPYTDPEPAQPVRGYSLSKRIQDVLAAAALGRVYEHPSGEIWSRGLVVTADVERLAGLGLLARTATRPPGSMQLNAAAWHTPTGDGLAYLQRMKEAGHGDLRGV